jgi:uncharacterized caspase-like protein
MIAWGALLARPGILVVLLACWLSASAMAAEKVALVIGISNYFPSWKIPVVPLPASSRDAEKLSDALRMAGFDVTTLTDVSKNAILSGAREMSTKTGQAEAVVLFYSGRVVTLDGRDYLTPAIAYLGTENEVVAESVLLEDLIQSLGGDGLPLVVVLDTAYPNQFETLSRPKGLQEIQVSSRKNMLLIRSTAPGAEAYSRKGQVGVFAAALIKHFTVKGLEVTDAARRVKEDVEAESGNALVPIVSSTLRQKVFLGGER